MPMTKKENDRNSDFSGSIPEIYDRCLGPLLFEFPAEDLGKRIISSLPKGARVLEVACGTGISTEFLRRTLPADVEIVATDLNPAMLEFARQRRGRLPNVRYELADALSLPFDTGRFDAVVCQFGIMFFPSIPQGLSEMHRVLRPGGLVACNVWDSLEVNRVAGIAHETIAEFFEKDPPTFLSVPFGSCGLESTADLLSAAGFDNVQSAVVDATVERPCAHEIAQGFVEGNPGILEIRDRASVAPAVIVEALANRLEEVFGLNPLRIPLREFAFTGLATA